MSLHLWKKQDKIMKIKFMLIIVTGLSLAGCQTVNSKMGNDPTAYANVTEPPPLKMPINAPQVSNRYDIPKIPNENGPIITKVVPPNF